MHMAIIWKLAFEHQISIKTDHFYLIVLIPYRDKIITSYVVANNSNSYLVYFDRFIYLLLLLFFWNS